MIKIPAGYSAPAGGKRSALVGLLLAPMLAMATAAPAAQPTENVLTYHADLDRNGNFVVPKLSWARARALHPDQGFHALIAGHIYAQPLYWRDGAQPGVLLVATEDDTVYALDAASGRTRWRRALGRPVPRASLPCGNIDPLGITGTPVIDPATGSIYLDAMRLDPRTAAPEHEIFALSLSDGSTRPGWPINVAAQVAAQGTVFTARNQNQRGALTILDNTLYVPYSGHFGDCGEFHGWVVGVKLRGEPPAVTSWHTRALGGGIWGPAGMSSDGRSLFVSTGNTMAASQWGGGEAVIRLDPALSFTGASTDFFAPKDWRNMDAQDADLGGVAPLLFRLGGADLVMALGKDRKAYLLDRRNLGGIGGALISQPVAEKSIRTAPAAYPVSDQMYVAFQGAGSGCPRPRAASGLTVLRVSAGAHAIATAWCASLDGAGAPIVTTTDGSGDPIVWILGAEGDNRLYAYRGDTGERLFVSAPLPGLRHFQTLIATSEHLYVAADNNVFAFTF